VSLPLRIVFMGTAELACPSLEALHAQKAFRLLAAVTQPDRPKGRDLKLTPSQVKVSAAKRNLAVLQPERARDRDFIAELSRLAPDLIVVAAYGQILPRAILDLPRYGCLNVHASLLPKYRGAAPIQWAILEDQKETGVTIMKMDEGMDTGDMLATVATPISPEDNASTIHDRLAKLGADLLVRTIPDHIAGKIKPLPQPSVGASYARKIKKEDGRIDWTRSAHEIWNMTRAFVPWPGAFTFLPAQDKPKLLKIWTATEDSGVAGNPGVIVQADAVGLTIACGSGGIRITTLQLEGGKKVTAREFLTGHPLSAGTKLS
jgi:methionyl-tRNA formyltransferase